MRIGHIDLSAHITIAEEQLVVLVEALSSHGIEQHVLVRNPFLAKRLSVCSGVFVGPIVTTAVTSCILMPPVDLLHAHEKRAVTAAMLLNLTRSTPYVITHRHSASPGNGLVRRMKYRRSAAIACPTEEIANALHEFASDKPVDTIGDARNIDDVIDAENGRISAARMAAEYLRVYRRTLDSRSVPAMLI